MKDKFGKFEIQPTDSLLKNLACDGIFTNWNIKNWEKVDVTNDGLTDLVFIAYWYNYITYAFIDKGNNKFQLIRFSKNSFENCELIKPIRIGTKNYLRLFRKTQQPDLTNKIPFSYRDVIITDTLVFKYNSFVELETPGNDIVKSIKMNTSGCFGSCPIFNLTLYPSGKGDFEGIEFTKTKGKSSRILSMDIFKELSDLANYINIKKLNDQFQVPWTDDQTATLTITFKNGLKKTIRDYGMQGKFGLSALYSKMTSLAVNW
ncbi:DUF6438 domain-containing protein [Pedobacter jejuensis]|uniref:DUF6438 domain-containing protein n=1 Tax=Pedobacter jejuensis TaxID=1268550 RepID=UPI0011CE92A6|nr:DUF6438 domain-containing protein [Pedobacter jejuensis]